MIVVDENIDNYIISRIAASNYQVFSIKDHQPGISDKEVIELTKSENSLLISEDKDFGELVFAHNIQGCSVILIRYEKGDIENIISNILKVLEFHFGKSDNYFYTITKNKIRTRKI